MTVLGSIFVVLVLLSTVHAAFQFSKKYSLHFVPIAWASLVGIAVFLSTELLSLFKALSSGPLFAFWSVFSFVLLYFFPVKALPKFTWKLSREPKIIQRCYYAITFILGVTLVLALWSPPNNWDSMTYHNARVMQWLDHHSVSHYFTHIDRQLRMPPLASYFKLHLFALTQSDFLFNSVQWVFFVICISVTGSISWILFRSKTVAAISALFAATLPMAILQATSTQNDLIAAAYLLCALLVLVYNFEKLYPLFFISLGLGALTKGTVYVYGGLAGVLALLVYHSRKALLAKMAAVSLIVFLLNAPHWIRNYNYFGNPAPATESVKLSALSATAIVSQITRNALFQLDFVSIDNDLPAKIVTALHGVLGIDPGNLELSTVPFSGPKFRLHEDHSGGALHFTLALAGLICALFVSRFRANRIFLMSITFVWVEWLAIAISVKWMPWNSRLQLPSLILFAVPVGWFLTEALKEPKHRIRQLALGAVVCCFLYSLPYLLHNQMKPLVRPSFWTNSRWENIFWSNSGVKESIENKVAQLPDDCFIGKKPIGIVLDIDEWEYPLWVRARTRGKLFSFKHKDSNEKDNEFCAILYNI